MSFLIIIGAVRRAERNSIMEKVLKEIIGEFSKDELESWKNKKKDFLKLMTDEMLERIEKKDGIEKYQIKEYLDDKIFWWNFKI
jgi:ketol-acid reductoisomerase